jgi:SAM-dependent methyltransferase
MDNIRSRFDLVYDSCIVGAGFVESDEYYRLEKERYWRSLTLLCQLDFGPQVKLLEIGGGQLAVLFKKLFDQDCTVADISTRYVTPLERVGVEFFEYNLLDRPPVEREGVFDIVILLEVIEHIPVPAYVVFERIKLFLRSSGVMFLTTPNLFRMRNLIRMILGIEYLDHYQLPDAKQGLGHQLEYSAEHLHWQLERAGMQVIMIEHDELGHVGHSVKARVGRFLMAPLGQLRSIWRDGLVAAARKN